MNIEHKTRAVVIALITVLLFAIVATTPVAAASETAIAVQPSEITINAGEKATVGVVIDDADGGVGAGELVIEVHDGSVATIADVQISGSPNFSNISWGAENSSAALTYAIADTDNTGQVTVLTATIRGESAGSTSLSVTSTDDNDDIKLFNEQGHRYEITSSTSGALSVGEVGDAAEDDDDESGGSGGGLSGSSGASGDSSTPDNSPPDSTDTNEEDLGDGDGDNSSSQDVGASDQSGGGDTQRSEGESDAETPTASEDSTETESDERTGPPPEDQSGFGLVVGLIALLATALIERVNRRIRILRVVLSVIHRR